MKLDEACETVGKRFFPRIRNPYGFLDTLPNWQPVFDAFPGQNAPGDLDGIMERHGQFLIIEKKSTGTPVKSWSGQARTLHAMHKLGVFTIIYMWGREDNPTDICVIKPNDRFNITSTPTTYDEFIAVLKAWWEFAESCKVY